MTRSDTPTSTMPVHDAFHHPRIAYVEDEDQYVNHYVPLLERHGFRVSTYRTKADALAAFDESMPDLALLDIQIGPDMDAGKEICKHLRRKSSTVPIIFLTNLSDDQDELVGLSLDADDYIDKGSPDPLIMVRIKTLLRRASQTPLSTLQLITDGPLRFDTIRDHATWRGQSLDLSLTNLWILKLLVQSPGSVFNIEQLMQAAKARMEPNGLVHRIKTIREAFETIDPDFNCIETVRSRGYRWRGAHTNTTDSTPSAH